MNSLLDGPSRIAILPQVHHNGESALQLSCLSCTLKDNKRMPALWIYLDVRVLVNAGKVSLSSTSRQNLSVLPTSTTIETQNVVKAMHLPVTAKDCDSAAVGVEGKGHRLANARRTICSAQED
jgi:hypothetical protein